MTKPVQSVVSLKSPIGTTTNLSVPILATLLSVAAAALWGSARTRRFTADAWQSQCETFGIVTTDAIYLALAMVFGDHPRQLYAPEYAVVLRRDTPVAQVDTVTVGGAGDGSYIDTINGTPFEYAAVGKTATEIRDAIVALIEAGSEPVTAAAVGVDQYTKTADVAGVPFTSSYSSPGDVLAGVNTTPSVGILDDLAAMDESDNTGYLIVDTGFTDQVMKLIGQYVQAATRPMRALLQTNTAAVATDVDTDVASVMGALGYTRTSIVWHNNAAEHLAAGWIGRCIAYAVGSINWAHKQISGATAIDFTVPSLAAAPGYLEAKNVNRYDAVGLNSTLYGTSLDGRFIDEGLLKDLLDLGITAYLLEYLQTTDIVYFDDDGVDQIATALKSYLKGIADQGALVASSITITPTAVADVGASDKAARNYPGLSWKATARGAMNRLISITGVVEV